MLDRLGSAAAFDVHCGYSGAAPVSLNDYAHDAFAVNTITSRFDGNGAGGVSDLILPDSLFQTLGCHQFPALAISDRSPAPENRVAGAHNNALPGAIWILMQ